MSDSIRYKRKKRFDSEIHSPSREKPLQPDIGQEPLPREKVPLTQLEGHSLPSYLGTTEPLPTIIPSSHTATFSYSTLPPLSPHPTPLAAVTLPLLQGNQALTAALPPRGACHPSSSIPSSQLLWKPGDGILDLYEGKGELGTGGMGKVYQVHHRGWGVDLAMKVPRPELMRDPTSRDAFIREAETWVLRRYCLEGARPLPS